MKRLTHLVRITLLAALLAVTTLSTKPVTQAHAEGATIAVGTADDEDPYDPNANNGYCSLREAIFNANNNTQVGNDDCSAGSGTESNTIIFGPNVGEIRLGGQLPNIVDPAGLTINGGGVVTLDGQTWYRLFYVGSAGVLTLDSIQLHHGYSSHGGAIISYGNLMVTHSVFYANKASQGGGAINQQAGNLTVANSIFLENFSVGPTSYAGAVGAMSGTTTLRNNTFSGNSSTQGGDLAVNLSIITASLVNNIFANSGGGGNCVKLNNAVSGNNNLFEDATSACGFTNGENGNIVGSDPAFDPSTFYGIALLSTSPTIDKGDVAACAAAPVNNTSLNNLPRPQGIHCDIGAYEYPQTLFQHRFYATATQDGWVLESSETSGAGGTKNTNATTLRIGDDAANKQYRTLLSFDTSALPEDVNIATATLWLKDAGKTGTNPFNTHGSLLVDVRSGSFAGKPALQLGDFSAKGTSATYKAKALIFTKANLDLANGWYSQVLNAVDYPRISRNGITQFRLRFAKDDNNDFGADFIKIVSANGNPDVGLPQLIIEYYVR